ncbi:Phosphatidylinositol mannoside acyltransferase [Corynebacterium atrinae]|uniref:phosphatidylinositol mannoside acyltransferase n=1 Tax=Corynebacterium atrinae TaxID=1336740 RepID=UPI0025B5CE55|nr:phosphatidylinositol mannoside acyltransferase [Corynebacterium atrinae]WJY63537.1 Phosphatidylinositol mannoside acyltransferase [Corynebacterium atrinae]
MRASLDPVAMGYLAGWSIVRRLPLPVSQFLFQFGADKASRNGRGMEQLRKNLTRVVGAENVTAELVRESVRSYARYWLEAFRLPAMKDDPELLAQLVNSVEGLADLDASITSGRGVVLTLPHSGNWDMAGLFLVHQYGQFATVAERLKPEVLFDAFVDYRQSLGFEVLAHTGGTPPFPRLREVLNDGGVVCLLGERDLKQKGVPVQLFGEATTMPAGPAQLALETGAALHAVHCWFTPKGWGFSVSPEVTLDGLGATTQRIADHFAASIARHPADWHMLQPQWTADVTRRQG